MTSSRPLRIQDATEADIPLILDLIRELAVFEKSDDRVSATAELLRANLFGPKRYAQAVIGYLGDKPVAYAIYYFSYSSFLGQPNFYLEDLFVNPALRGQGLGNELFAFLASRASERGCGRMEWAVLNWNEKAISFYEKLGAVPVREWTTFHLAKEKFEDLAKTDS